MMIDDKNQCSLSLFFFPSCEKVFPSGCPDHFERRIIRRHGRGGSLTLDGPIEVRCCMDESTRIIIRMMVRTGAGRNFKTKKKLYPIRDVPAMSVYSVFRTLVDSLAFLITTRKRINTGRQLARFFYRVMYVCSPSPQTHSHLRRNATVFCSRNNELFFYSTGVYIPLFPFLLSLNRCVICPVISEKSFRTNRRFNAEFRVEGDENEM